MSLDELTEMHRLFDLIDKEGIGTVSHRDVKAFFRSLNYPVTLGSDKKRLSFAEFAEYLRDHFALGTIQHDVDSAERES